MALSWGSFIHSFRKHFLSIYLGPGTDYIVANTQKNFGRVYSLINLCLNFNMSWKGKFRVL